MKDEGWPTVWRIPRHEGTHVGSATDPLFTTYERPEEKEDGVRGMRRSACGVDGLCNSSSSAGSPSGYDCSVNTSSVYLKRSSHVRPSAAPRRQMVGGAGTQRGVGCVSCGPVGSDVAVHPSPFTPVTLHPCNPSPLHPFTLHPSSFTLHPAPCTLHPARSDMGAHSSSLRKGGNAKISSSPGTIHTPQTISEAKRGKMWTMRSQ